MTESEWHACTDPQTLLAALGDGPEERELRLLACACCRRVGYLITDRASRRAIEVAERFADGTASEQELARAHRAGWETWANWPTADVLKARAAAAVTWVARPSVGMREAARALQCSLEAEARMDPAEARLDRCALIRDLFGNPFQLVAADPAWRTPNVLSLARAIYQERRFEDLPVLADALEEAGCTDGDILAHCRQGGGHVRGCWVVDLVLLEE
jgi:hypothetical protein